MLRLTLLLCAGMFAALMIAGEDRGQLRPGLAAAEAEGLAPKILKPASMAQDPAPVAQVVEPPAPVAELAAVAVADAQITETPDVAPLVATTEDQFIEPVRATVQVLEEPIFTLSALGNELVPGEAGTVLDTVAVAEPEASSAGDGTIWYVNASSVNVRAEPSTDAEVLGKLGNGEAALLVATVDGNWGRIVIQGDGMEGFVAMRYLSPAAP